jgi:drug/metabolite transporter (DMT)-like permease
VALLGESLGPLTLVGGVVVLVGLWLIEHRGASQPAQPSHSGAAVETG